MTPSKFLLFLIVCLLLLTACGIPSRPAQGVPLTATTSSTSSGATTVNATHPLLKTAMGEFAILSAQLANEAQEDTAPNGYKFLLIGLAQPDMRKLVAGEFSFEDFQSMSSNTDGQIYVLGSDGSKTNYRGMGGWLDNDEPVADDFVMGFLVPITETYTLYWADNPPIQLSIEP